MIPGTFVNYKEWGIPNIPLADETFNQPRQIDLFLGLTFSSISYVREDKRDQEIILCFSKLCAGGLYQEGHSHPCLNIQCNNHSSLAPNLHWNSNYKGFGKSNLWIMHLDRMKKGPVNSTL
jgi:hypothetical protein